MFEDVVEFIAIFWVGRQPVAYVFHAVSFKNFGGMVGKAGDEVRHFPRVGGVNAQFKNGSFFVGKYGRKAKNTNKAGDRKDYFFHGD